MLKKTAQELLENEFQNELPMSYQELQYPMPELDSWGLWHLKKNSSRQRHKEFLHLKNILRQI